MNIIPLSRLDMYEFWCDPELIDEVNNELLNPSIDWEPIKNNPTGLSIGYSDVPYYHYKLFDWFQECLNIVSNLHYNNTPLVIVDSWVTKSEFGKNATAHYHVASVVSGLLYLSTFKNSGTIFKYADPWHDHIYNLIEPSDKTIKITPEKGKLILWRSDIIHSAQVHSDIKSIRNSLAFNTFFDGTLSNLPTGKLSLKVESVKDKYETYINKKNNETM